MAQTGTVTGQKYGTAGRAPSVALARFLFFQPKFLPLFLLFASHVIILVSPFDPRSLVTSPAHILDLDLDLDLLDFALISLLVRFFSSDLTD